MNKLPEKNPMNSYSLAHEATWNEIDLLFRTLPWMYYLELSPLFNNAIKSRVINRNEHAELQILMLQMKNKVEGK